jgi:transcription antitermination protein NusB
VSARGKARKRALDVIFEADAKAVPVQQVLAEHQRRRESESETSLNEYSVFLVNGVVEHQGEIDALITAHATGWDLARMPGVDRAILRIAVFEVTNSADVPTAVAISEAVRMAEELSTEQSAGFINGVLGAVAVATAS